MEDPDDTAEPVLTDHETALMEWADETDPDPYADSEWAAGCNG